HRTLLLLGRRRSNSIWSCSVFFFQAEDGMRAFHVTGVQTCALPISFRAVHSSRQRALWAGVFDETGTQGYGVIWDSAASGTGTVGLLKFDLASEVGWADAGAALGPRAASGHNPTSFANPMA